MNTRAYTVSIFSAAFWVSLTVFGEFIFGWSSNGACSPFFGCVSGFFGADAFEHFFFGVAAVMALVWFCERFPNYSILHNKRWKTAIVLVATVALVSVLWEIVECAHDAIRVDVLHLASSTVQFHISLLEQPGNLDTMGDLSFSLLGSIIVFFLYFCLNTIAFGRVRPGPKA